MKTLLGYLRLPIAIVMFSTTLFAAASPVVGNMIEPSPPLPEPRNGSCASSFHIGSIPPSKPIDMPGPAGAVIQDLDQLEALYTLAGSNAALLVTYRDVLKKSKDPRVRQYTYEAIARAQMRPNNVADAIATVRQSLDEILARQAETPPSELGEALK